MRIPPYRRSWKKGALALAVAGALFLWTVSVAGAEPPWPSDPASPEARQVADLYQIVLWIALAVFAVVEGILLYSVVRFRRRDETVPAQVHGHTGLEIAWTAAPAVIVAILAVLSFQTMFAGGSGRENPLTVEVVGHQWFWEYRYPDEGFVTATDMVVPTGRAIRLEVTTADVIHSFWVPRLSGKIDASPGLVNEIWFTVEEPGTFEGQCAEFCGIGHPYMPVRVIALDQMGYEEWAEAQRAAAAPAQGLAAEGENLVTGGACAACHTVRGTAAVGLVGPDLTHFASRSQIGGMLANTPENLALWLADPHEQKPGTRMPNMGLTAEEIEAIVAYLKTLE
ncbi:MAG: cytochrome c oxidase subunit II [Anaerolineae bacterium]